MFSVTVTTKMAEEGQKSETAPLAMVQKLFKDQHQLDVTEADLKDKNKFDWKYDPHHGGMRGQWTITKKD